MAEVAAAAAPPAAEPAKRRWPTGLLLPSAVLWPLGVAPLVLLAIVSLAENVPGGSYVPGFEATHYLRLLEPRYAGVLFYSLWLSALVAVIAVTIGFPFTYFVTRQPRRVQVLWLVGLMTVLSLSEVLVAFAWQVLLSRNIGLSKILVVVGLLESPISLQPGFGAVLVALVYLVLPYTFLLFYPSLSRFDRSLTEAAGTMGAGPGQQFLTVVLPVMRIPIFGSLLLVFVYVLGAYVTPSQLGSPEHWTVSVYITDQVFTVYNLPFAAAMAMALMVVSVALVLLSAKLGESKR